MRRPVRNDTLVELAGATNKRPCLRMNVASTHLWHLPVTLTHPCSYRPFVHASHAYNPQYSRTDCNSHVSLALIRSVRDRGVRPSGATDVRPQTGETNRPGPAMILAPLLLADATLPSKPVRGLAGAREAEASAKVHVAAQEEEYLREDHAAAQQAREQGGQLYGHW